MKKIYIAHPLRGADREKNVEEVTKICKKVVELFPDVLPVSPIHAFSFLDNCGAEGEKKALELCLETLKNCDEAWFFGEWEGSEGCSVEWATTFNADGKLIFALDYSHAKAEEKADAYKSALSIDGPEKALVEWLLAEVYAEPETLAPCPFCGGAPILNEKQTFIACDNPDCVINPCLDWEIEPKTNTKAEAIAAWNRRAGA